MTRCKSFSDRRRLPSWRGGTHREHAAAIVLRVVESFWWDVYCAITLLLRNYIN